MIPAAGSPGYWCLALLLLALLMAQSIRTSRRRVAMNRALHELRRPLQALALILPEQNPAQGLGASQRPPVRHRGIAAGSLWQAIRAAGDLELELNGGRADSRPEELVAGRLLAEACVRRLRPRAKLEGANIELRWAGPDALIRGDGVVLSGALENLLLNAIEHGGRLITVNALTVAKRLRIEVIDSGRDPQAGGLSRILGRQPALRARHQHGHGLKVVRQAAAEHEGRFSFQKTGRGSCARLVLPVNSAGASRGAAIRDRW